MSDVPVGWLLVPSAVECPTWCRLPRGHAYEDAQLGDGLGRDHGVHVTVGSLGVVFSQWESAAGPAGPIALGRPEVAFVSPGRGSVEIEADPERLRALGRLLIDLADHVLPSVASA